MTEIWKKADRSNFLEQTIEIAELVWKAGVYARLSVDSNERKNESIDTQIEIAKAFISRTDDIELIECYTDLGKSGRNFKRDGFERMMADIRGKKINCVVVKDLSRFGRNFIETGNYIEKIFPFMNVRFIAITDGYDSEHIEGDNIRLSMHLKNIVNELYAKDIGQRVKTAKKLKQEMGSYTGGRPPYGYCVETVGNRKVLIPDSATKGIVVRIFERYARGDYRKEIIEELYQERVRRPRGYQATGEVYCPEGEKLQQWSDGTLKGILTNPVYIGTLMQARICGKQYQGHKRHEVKNEDITIVEHNHEPIISEDLFYKVLERFERQSKYSNHEGFSKKIPQSQNILKDKVYCGGCGRRLLRYSQVKTLTGGDRVRNYYYFTCPNRDKIDERTCKCQGISVRTLEKILKAALEKEFSLSNVRSKDYCKKNKDEAEKRKDMITKKKKESMRQHEELALAGSKLYLRYREGGLSREAFLEEKKKAGEKLELLKKQEEIFAEQEKMIDQEADKMNRFIRGLMRCKGDFEFDRELVECLISRINVFPEHQVEIIWNYRENDLLLGRKAHE